MNLMDNEKKTSKKKDDRVRTWTFIVYPDSAPTDWKEQLTSLGVKGAISPLHDRDVNADGTPKKAHFHVVITFDGKKSFEQIKEITDSLNAPMPQKGKSANGLVRYFTHIDNPEKAQYKQSDIVAFGGFDIRTVFELSRTDKLGVLKEVLKFCKDNEITEMHVLMDILIQQEEHQYLEWLDLVANKNTLIVSAYLASLRHSTK